jgi:hydrogenase expression/formation protein HypD
VNTTVSSVGSLRDRDVASRVIAELRATLPADRVVRVMHVCGSHERTVGRFGLRSILPEGIELIAGPGCPVCICPAHEVDEAIEIARQGAIVATFGDMLHLPARDGSLADARAHGADVRVVYGPLDAIRLAADNADREVVLFAVGFETTAGPVAAMVDSCPPPPNFSLLVSHRLTAPAVEALLDAGEISIDAVVAPGHVSTIVGRDAWARLPERYGLSTVVAGFEPHDVLLALLMIARQIARGDAVLENEYARVVEPAGNTFALEAIERVFEVGPAWWRGIGEIPGSGLRLRGSVAHLDARERFGVRLTPRADDLPRGCSCRSIMLGNLRPPECRLYGKRCTPDNPVGPCMVSQEGTCRIWSTSGADRACP